MKYELVLASESPRRRELLKNAGFQFTVHPSKISETLEENLTIDEQILDIARKKTWTSVRSLSPTKALPRLVLGADTMVVLDNRPLGKPEGPEEALRTLRLLSGRSHWVKTAVCLVPENSQNEKSWIETTQVTFRSLSEAEIQAYVQTGEALDKAGSYGIQGGAGQFVEQVLGSYTNVVGLPMESLIENLALHFSMSSSLKTPVLPQWQQKRSSGE